MSNSQGPNYTSLTMSSPGSSTSSQKRATYTNKLSLDFLLHATPSPPAKRSRSTASVTVFAPSRTRLDRLPRDVLSVIAQHLVLGDEGPARGSRSRNRQHPSALIPLLLTNRAVYNKISFESNPQLYNALFRGTFNTAALVRRYQYMIKHLSIVAGRGKKVYDLFNDPRSWAIDYKSRWELSQSMKRVVRNGSMDMKAPEVKEQVTADLWTIWFVLTENDGRNLAFLAEQCNLQAWMKIYHRDCMLFESIVPGLPKQTGENALGLWCALLSGLDSLSEETDAQIDEKIFVLRPFVFACARYEFTYGPWRDRKLPRCEASCTAHGVDTSSKSKPLDYKRFGYSWKRSPPHFVLGSYLTFLRLLERHPSRMSLQPGSSIFLRPPSQTLLEPGLFSSTRILPSIYHDREWQRDTVCQDPHVSPGLPPLTFMGDVQGYWRGRIFVIDFEKYREILGGDIRLLYTMPFAQHAAEMQLKETIIRVKKEDVGGKGSSLDAGFDPVVLGVNTEEEEQERVEAGYGHEVVPVTAGIADEDDEEGWTKEILVSGISRTIWGQAFLRGRIRSWDGLLTLSAGYNKASEGEMSRWLWRGYLQTGGHILGRWRETYTPEQFRGYEGAFGIIRAGDVFYPDHFPKSMSESRGIVASGKEILDLPGWAALANANPLSTKLERPESSSGDTSSERGSQKASGEDTVTIPVQA